MQYVVIKTEILLRGNHRNRLETSSTACRTVSVHIPTLFRKSDLRLRHYSRFCYLSATQSARPCADGRMWWPTLR